MQSIRKFGIGSTAGVVGGLCGIGGGALMIPVLKSATTLPAHTITATSLFAVCLGSTSGAVSYTMAGLVDVPAAAAVTVTSVLGAAMGARVNPHVSGKTLYRLLALVNFGSIPVVWCGTRRPATATSSSMATPPTVPMTPTAACAVPPEAVASATAKAPTPSAAPAAATVTATPATTLAATPALALPSNAMPLLPPGVTLWTLPAAAWHAVCEKPALLGVGALGGFLSGVLGIGGGLLSTTLLGTLMPQQNAVAVSLAVMVPTALTATAVNLLQGNVAVRAGLLLGAGCVAGMAVSSRLIAPSLDEATLRYGYLAVLVLSGLQLLR